MITLSGDRLVYRPGPLFYAVATLDHWTTNPNDPRPARKPPRHKAPPRPRRQPMKLATIRKAIVGALSAAVAAAVVAYPDGFTGTEIGTIVGAAVVAGLAVFGIRNEPKGA